MTILEELIPYRVILPDQRATITTKCVAGAAVVQRFSTPSPGTVWLLKRIAVVTGDPLEPDVYLFLDDGRFDLNVNPFIPMGWLVELGPTMRTDLGGGSFNIADEVNPILIPESRSLISLWYNTVNAVDYTTGIVYDVAEYIVD